MGERWSLSAKGPEGALWPCGRFCNLTVAADYTGVYMCQNILSYTIKTLPFCVSKLYLNKVGYQKKKGKKENVHNLKTMTLYTYISFTLTYFYPNEIMLLILFHVL